MIKRIFQRLNNPVFILRLFFTLIAVNFAGILYFANVNPLNLLNPLRFLDASPSDSREKLTLFFTKDPFLYSLEDEKDLSLKDRVLSVKQKVYMETKKNDDQIKITQNNAHHIITELILGPQEMTANRLTREKNIIKKIWFKDSQLIIHLNKEAIEKMEVEKVALLKYSIERSLYANLKNVRDILIVED